jgi:hypothetical protein
LGFRPTFLVDFFHICEYLAEASSWCNDVDPKGWLEEKKKMMQAGSSAQLLCELKIKLSQLEAVSDDNGLAKCVRYMEKRAKHLDYAQAKQAELPIGSGEIESSHRHIVQKRLK